MTDTVNVSRARAEVLMRDAAVPRVTRSRAQVLMRDPAIPRVSRASLQILVSVAEAPMTVARRETVSLWY